MPITIDWPEEIYRTPEALWSVLIGEKEYLFGELNVELMSPSVGGALRFAIASETDRAELELSLFEESEIPNYRFSAVSDRKIQIRRGERAQPGNMVDLLYDNPPMIWFSDGSALEGNQYVELKSIYPPYDPTRPRSRIGTGQASIYGRSRKERPNFPILCRPESSASCGRGTIT